MNNQSQSLRYLSLLLLAGSTLMVASTVDNQVDHYDPTWESLEKRSLPTWYDKAKIGVFVHWGVFSVPAFASEWFWNQWKRDVNKSISVNKFIKDNYPPKFTYQEFAKDFTAEHFNATDWAEIFVASGAKYVVLTSKHHEGFTLWPSKYAFSWNSMDIGPHRDLVGELAKAVRKNSSLVFGLYHSLYEWYNPLYLHDKANNFTTQEFVKMKTMPELYELVNTYKPELIWSDGEWEASDDYWQAKEFIAWLYNSSPVKDTIVVNDRWGSNTLCKHGGYFTCQDNYNPGKLQAFKFENAMTIDSGSWGYRKNARLEDFLSFSELLAELVMTVSCGGNFLMNVGPTKEGMISPIYEERLRQIGDWLKVNGEAIYASNPWETCQTDTLSPNVWYTKVVSESGTSLYAVSLKRPLGDSVLALACLSGLQIQEISVLGLEKSVKYGEKNRTILIQLPPEIVYNPTNSYTFKIKN